jgi:hypothetical protein
MSMNDVKRCPWCGSDEVLPIAYGLPSPQMIEESIAGRLLLGGDMVWLGAPDMECVACGHNWRSDKSVSRAGSSLAPSPWYYPFQAGG